MTRTESEDVAMQKKNLFEKRLNSTLLKLDDKKSGSILIDQFAEVLVSSGSLINRIERILTAMRSPSLLLAHSVVSKCMLLLDKQPRARLEELYEQGNFEAEFGGLFNRLLLELGFVKTLEASNIRELYAEEIFEGIGAISLPLNISNEASHHDNHMDMMFVVAAAKLRSAKRIFEFGTYTGRTTCGLASIADDVKVFTLNLPPEDDPRYGPYIGTLIKNSPYRDRVEQLFSDSRKFDTGAYTSSMDYVFVDADHSYEGVKNDSLKAFEMLKPRGMIIWHDYAPKSPGVVGYLKELSLQRPLFRIRNTCLVLHIDGMDTNEFEPQTKAGFLEDAP